VVNPGATTGAACIINTHATLEHDCRLGDNVHLAPGATVSGGVVIGSHSFVGAGAVVIQGVRIADGCLIGAGTVVTADIVVPGTYAGVPARRIG
jgi:acetyltransferase-like isoleucine patch superfamily enzyme